MENKSFKALVTDHEKIQVTEEEFRELNKGEVLIKMHSMPINPNDRYIVTGFFNFGEPGKFKGIGFEGSGKIIEVGQGVDPSLVGKKAAMIGNPFTRIYQGSWRQYCYCEIDDIAVYPDEADYDLMSSTFINPFTALAMIDFCKKKEAKCVVQDAACSSLGKMFCKAAKKHGIQTINIVRRPEQIEILTDEGAEFVLDSSAYDFNLDLSQMMRELKPSIYFSSVGGSLVENIMFKMPPSSTVVLIGSLENQDISFLPSVFIFSKLTITYLTMFEWLYMLAKEQKEECIQAIVADITSSDSVYSSHIIKTFSFEEAEEAVKYSTEHASEGKVVLRAFSDVENVADV